MAKKESKSKQHTRDLVAGMVSSNSQSKTPISTLYPKKTTASTAKTSLASRSKGTKGQNTKNPSGAPQKFLLSVTNPGNRPTAPSSPGTQPLSIPNPATELSSGRLTYRSYSRGSFDRRAASYDADSRDYNTRTGAYTTRQTARTNWQTALGTYNTNLANYNNTTLPNWTTASNQYTSRTSKNAKTTSTYKRDVAKFVNSLSSKKGATRGSRNTNTRSGGARS